MKKTIMVRCVCLLLILGGSLAAQDHELGLTLGRINGPSRTIAGGTANLDSGIALQANYGYRFWSNRHLSLSADVHFLANGQREVRGANPALTRDIATLFVTPGLRVKFAPVRRISPWISGGAGYALYEQSFFRIDGASNPAPRFTHRGAVMFGGGADFPLWRWIGGRLEMRDFYTGNPSLNTALRSGQHNVVVGGGLLLRFGGVE
jgi:hypothetical protein